MHKHGNGFEAYFDDETCGECLAEIPRLHWARQDPDIYNRHLWGFKVKVSRTLLSPPNRGRAPQINATNEAMRYLDPHSLNPAKYGTMLVTPRAASFFRGFDKATKRKLLDPVQRGETLLILQQDFANGQYPLDFFTGVLACGGLPHP